MEVELKGEEEAAAMRPLAVAGPSSHRSDLDKLLDV